MGVFSPPVASFRLRCHWIIQHFSVCGVCLSSHGGVHIWVRRSWRTAVRYPHPCLSPTRPRTSHRGPQWRRSAAGGRSLHRLLLRVLWVPPLHKSAVPRGLRRRHPPQLLPSWHRYPQSLRARDGARDVCVLDGRIPPRVPLLGGHPHVAEDRDHLRGHVLQELVDEHLLCYLFAGGVLVVDPGRNRPSCTLSSRPLACAKATGEMTVEAAEQDRRLWVQCRKRLSRKGLCGKGLWGC